MENRVRELALFNLGIDSKLRGSDLVGLKVRDVCHGEQVASRAVVVQRKTQRPVQFEITAATRDAVQKWIKRAGLKSATSCFLAGFTTRHAWARVSTRGSSRAGSRTSALILLTTGHTRCGEPRRL